MGGYDDLKIQAIDRFRSQDPNTLSNSELRSAIDYMLAYRWALDGDEDVLNEYIEAFKMRSINNTKNESQTNKNATNSIKSFWLSVSVGK